MYAVRDENLRRRRIELLRDFKHLRVVGEFRLPNHVVAKGAVSGDMDVVLLAEGVELILLQEWMRLNLVDGLRI